MNCKYRYYQEDADKAIYEELQVNNKCIVKMFCGTGKSLLMRKCRIIKNKHLVVYVFPSLSLIDQFYTDYLYDISVKNILKISSETESTTDVKQITKFLSKKTNKIICITYQSFKTLLDNLGKTIIDVCIFDEAHHAVGETYQKLIFNNENDISVCEKQIFFTATPKNANGIVMYDRDNLDSCMCGKLVYDYSYLRGMNEDYLNPFEIRVDMYTENTNKSVYESIARATLVSGNNRVLTFHSDVNTERDTSVNNFVDEKEFITAFKKVQETEFQENKKYTKISMIGLSSSIGLKERKTILNTFDSTPDDEIIVISSCETIGEGIDTKKANMCVFVDPKSSYVKIIQNIGRIVRKQFGIAKPNSTILIPCWVDKTKYLECNGDREKCDEVIRQDMSEGGNFNGILNVLSALKQEDEDIYDICLHYPDTYSPQEIKSNLEKQGYTIDDQIGDGYLVDTLEHLLDTEIDYENYDTDEEMIMNIAEENDVCIEIHTNSLENPVERYNPECEEIVRLYKYNDELEEDQETIYQPIIKKDKQGSKKNTGLITSPKRENRMNFKVHTNPDIKVLWNISRDFDITKDICSCVIDCEVVDKWYDNFEELKKFIDENNKTPSQRSTNEKEKKLGQWISSQQKKYKRKINRMKNEKKYNLWTEFLEEYKEYFKDWDEIWKENFEELKKFINENKRRPNSSIKNENKLAVWIGTHNRNYKKKAEKMKDEMRYNLWSNFLEEYKEYFKNCDEIWYERFNELKNFMDENKRRPRDPRDTENVIEQQNGIWLCRQIQTYKTKTKIMKNKIIYNLWTEFLEEFKEYFKDNDEIWNKNFEELKIFIKENKKRPNANLKNNEGKIGNWLCVQNRNYIKKTEGMKNESRYNLWSNFLEEYKEYLKSDDDIWYEHFEELKKFINDNKRTPTRSSNNKIEKTIGEWLSDQKKYYKKKSCGMKNETRYILWSNFLEEYKEYLKSNDEIWYEKFSELKNFMNKNKKRPSKNNNKSLNQWLNLQIKNYKKKLQGMKDETRYKLWTEFTKKYLNNLDTETETSTEEENQSVKEIPKKSMKLKKPSKKEKEESQEQKRERVKSEISVLHQRYKTMNSKNLHQEFNNSPDIWHKYHQIAEENEKSFPDDDIPRNRVIQELNKIKTKRTKQVVDMGCGKAQIAQYFQTDNRFKFINYDHISSNDTIISCDISNTPLEDDSVEICILSLAMWGSNCREYIQEANRVLESGGKLYIIEPTKRWSEQDEQGNIIAEKEGSKMKTLLEENGFKIVEQSIEKFCLFVCIKI
jgi:ribosomal RNA-processing protein 8